MTEMKATRRAVLGSMAGFAAAVTGVAAEAAQQTAGAQPAAGGLTADEALALLRKGNAEFLTDAPYRNADTRERRLELADGQSPFAILVGCSDSRVSPELLFGRGLGELFIIRVAGNTVDTAAIGSIEYGVGVLGVPLIVVLGHEKCGAVEAAVNVVTDDATFPGHIGNLIEPIVPAVLAAQDKEGDLLANSVRANVERVVAEIDRASPIVRQGIADGNVKIVGAVYGLKDGVVTFLDGSEG